MRDDSGEIYTVRNEQVNATLLNEFLKEHGTGDYNRGTQGDCDQAARRLRIQIAQRQKQIQALPVGLQKVSAAVELNKAAATRVADTR